MIEDEAQLSKDTFAEVKEQHFTLQAETSQRISKAKEVISKLEGKLSTKITDIQTELKDFNAQVGEISIKVKEFEENRITLKPK